MFRTLPIVGFINLKLDAPCVFIFKKYIPFYHSLDFALLPPFLEKLASRFPTYETILS